jgi:His-Xaa-Ser system protein HxsD
VEARPDLAAQDAAGSMQVDTRVFSLSAIKKAAYRFSDRFFVAIDSDREPEVRVRFTAKPGIAADLNIAVGEFRNELLDQDLRERIRGETEGVRRLLLAHALSQVPLIQPELDTSDYDPDASTQR